MQKFLNWFLIIALSLIIVIGGGYISYMILFGSHSGHTNMRSSTQGASNNAAADEHSSHSAHSQTNNTAASEHSSHSTGYNLDISSESSSANLAESVQNTNSPPKKKEPDLTNVVFIDYIVNPTDTLWRISKIYMPDFPVLDTGDTMGMAAYIAQKNKLKKGNNGEYIIYYGQKLKIPAELSVVSKVINTTNSSKADTNNTNNAYNTTDSTPIDNESLPSTQTDHSSHTGHSSHN